jgi:hypothetical protein
MAIQQPTVVPTQRVSNFMTDLSWSKRVVAIANARAVLYLAFPDAKDVSPTHDLLDDWNGADFEVKLKSGCTVHVDQKDRRKSAAQYWTKGAPDVCLELVQNMKTKAPGWATVKKSKTDYFLFTFESLPNWGWLFEAPSLVAAVNEHEAEWRKQYRPFVKESTRTDPATGKTWLSEAFFIPVDVLLAATDGHHLILRAGEPLDSRGRIIR